MPDNRSSEQQPAGANVFEQQSAQMRRELGRAEVKSAREQALLERTRAYIDVYQQVLYEHGPNGSIKRDSDGLLVEKSDTVIQELLFRTSSPHVREAGGRSIGLRLGRLKWERKGRITGDNPEYNPQTAFVCAQILSERTQNRVQEKQMAYSSELEEAIQAFHDTKAESELIFYNSPRTGQKMKMPRPVERTSPDLAAIEAAQNAYESNRRRAESKKTTLEAISATQKTAKGQFEIPTKEARVSLVTTLEFYWQRKVDLEAEIKQEEARILQSEEAREQGLNSSSLRKDPPEKLGVVLSEHKKLATLFENIAIFTDPETGETKRDNPRQHLERAYTRKELLTTARDAKGKVDTYHLARLRQIQLVTARFVQERQDRLLAEQQTAVQVLTNNDISGVEDLQRLTFYEEQFKAYEREWLKQMGGNLNELQRRIEWWGGLKAERSRVAEAVQAEREGINAMAQIVEGLLKAKTPEEVAAMKDKVVVMNAVVGMLSGAGMSKREIQMALGLAPEREAAVREIAGETEVFKVIGGVESLAHPGHPDRNEDSYYLNEAQGMAGVFDGVGGGQQGEKASKMARDIFEQTVGLLDVPDNLADQQKQALIEEKMREAFIEANRKILEFAKDQGILSATAGSMVKIWRDSNGERIASVGNVGASRVVIKRADGHLERVTIDQNWPGDQLRNGIISQGEADTHDRRGELMNFLGGGEGYALKPDRIDIHHVKLNEGDEVLITSYGVHNNLNDQVIERLFRENASATPQELAQKLAERARWVGQFEAMRTMDGSKRAQLFGAVELAYPDQNFNQLSSNECVQAVLEGLAELGPELSEIVDNPLVNRVRFRQLVDELRQNNSDFVVGDVRAVFEENLGEIFPGIERAMEADATAVILKPLVERQTPTRTREEGGIYLGPEDVANLFRVIAELPSNMPQQNRGENERDYQNRLGGSLKEGGDLHNYLVGELGEEQGSAVARRARPYAARMSWVDLMTFIFQEIFKGYG